MRGFARTTLDAWRLSTPFFRSEERASAWGLLLGMIVLRLLLVGMSVVLNFWNGAFFDSLQRKDWDAFTGLLFVYYRTAEGWFGIMPGFCVIAALYIVVAIYYTYLNQWLLIHWRRWMSERLLRDWLADRTYYRLGLTPGQDGAGIENPDQRISEDVRDFVRDTLSLGLSLLSTVVSLFSFLGILWTLSGPLTVLGVTIPGYMVWVALIYAVVGSVLTHLIGRRLSGLRFLQQRYEADFRFSLARLRENTEGVALYAGEAEETGALLGRFNRIVANWWEIMRRTKALNALSSGYEQVAAVFPIVVISPRYFSGAIQLGGLTRTSSAFGQVQSALSWFINQYFSSSAVGDSSLTSWAATIHRLMSFEDAIVASRTSGAARLTTRFAARDELAMRGVSLDLPDGTPLLRDADLVIPRGQSTLISGASGCGKSTLFRAAAGLWPFGTGTVEQPPGQRLFLPQRPYIPLGSLRRAVTYPGDASTFTEAEVAGALGDAGLGHLVPLLSEEATWTQRLSGGEQQRLAVARALLLRPDWLFLDEATANLDPQAEAALHAVLRERLPGTTIVSIAHRPELGRLHDRHLVLRREPGSAGQLRDADQQADSTSSTSTP